MNTKEITNINNYFSNATCNLEDKNLLQDFLRDFKKHCINMTGCSKELIGERLYDSSCSIIYYPNVRFKSNGKSILLVSHELSRTGAPVVVLDTAKVLVKNGCFVTVISMKTGPLLEEFLNIGVPVIIMNGMKYVQYFSSDISLFYDKMDLDVFVHSFDVIFMVTATLYNFVRRYFNTDIKIYWWIHEGSESYKILGDKMPKTISKNIKVVCGGDYAVKQLEKNGFLYYPSVLNYGVYDECKNINYKTNEIVTFMMAGTIGVRKGQLILLEAIKKLSVADLEKAKFIFIGDCYENDEVGHEIKEEIENSTKLYKNIQLLKSVSREELYELYKKIDVLVLASIDDPMPVVATENFMLGNICLVSTCTGSSYYINNKRDGFIFKTGDSDDLKEKLAYIINNKDSLEEIRKNGRKTYDDYFTMDIFEKKILKLIQEVR